MTEEQAAKVLRAAGQTGGYVKVVKASAGRYGATHAASEGGDYLDRARAGDEVVTTDRGIPVARLLGLTAAATLERLAADGIIARATAPARPPGIRAAPPPAAPAVGDRHR